jgi:hypothetical protein
MWVGREATRFLLMPARTPLSVSSLATLAIICLIIRERPASRAAKCANRDDGRLICASFGTWYSRLQNDGCLCQNLEIRLLIIHRGKFSVYEQVFKCLRRANSCDAAIPEGRVCTIWNPCRATTIRVSGRGIGRPAGTLHSLRSSPPIMKLGESGRI